MALMPKRSKHRKQQRGKIRGHATRGHRVAFGDFGIQSLEPGWITARQIEAGRVALAQMLRGVGRYWIRVFPDKPVTARPAETRMGKGKGEPDFWAAVIKPGTILYEVGGVSEDVARLALNRVAHKLPVRCRLAHRLPEV
jgi:large subunit ribosomal protein L16